MHTHNEPTADLVTLAQRGDADAFEAAIYRPYERMIYSFVYRMMGDPDDAYDLTIDVFVKAYRSLGRTSADLNVSAWLHKIAANACLDVLRRRARLRWLPWNGPKHDHLLVSPQAADPEQSAVVAETRALVRAALARLEPRDRAVLVLHEWEQMDCTQIGAVLGISRSAVKSARFRAFVRFRAAYAAVEAARMGEVA